MAKPYDYDCVCKIPNPNGYKGRQGEIFFNGDLHNIYEWVRYIGEYYTDKSSTPPAKHLGAMWYDRRNNELLGYVGNTYKNSERLRSGWIPVFSEKFQITDEILNDLPSANPVLGQLWIYNGMLMYYDGADWQPVKTLEQTDSQFNISVFSDFQIYAPLDRLGSMIVQDLMIENYLKHQEQYLRGVLDLENDTRFTVRIAGQDGEQEVEYAIDGTIYAIDTNGQRGEIIQKDQIVGVLEKNRWRFDYEWPEPGTKHIVNFLDGYYQYLIPNITVDRVFLNDKLDDQYIADTRSVIRYPRSTIVEENYDTQIFSKNIPSCVHINPGKLSRVIKRVFKVDRDNPIIQCSAHNTEFYGFKIYRDSKGVINSAKSHFGHWLRPSKSPAEVIQEKEQNENDLKRRQEELAQIKERLAKDGIMLDNDQINSDTDEGDYRKMADSNGGYIYLSWDASQKYDYVLCITYEFSWYKSTGVLRTSDTRIPTSAYYLPSYFGPVNVFINGFDYEDTHYEVNGVAKTVTLAEDTTDSSKYDVQFMRTLAHEYGYIRTEDLRVDGWAIIKTVHQFKHPLVLVNGEAILERDWTYTEDESLLTDFDEDAARVRDYITGTRIKVRGARRDMCWTVIELCEVDPQNENNVHDILLDEGYVGTDTDSHGNPCIKLYKDENIFVDERDHPEIVLFINGLMIRRNDVFAEDRGNYYAVTVDGLEAGMPFIMLNDHVVQYDKDGRGEFISLYREEDIMHSLSIGGIDQSIVYLNGYLLNEMSSVVESYPPEIFIDHDKEGAKMFAGYNEVRAFRGIGEADNYVFKIFDSTDTTYGSNGSWRGGIDYIAVRAMLSDFANLGSPEAINAASEKVESELEFTVHDRSLGQTIKEEISAFCNSYVNGLTSVSLNFAITESDKLDVFGYSFANSVKNTVSIVNKWIHQDDPLAYVTDISYRYRRLVEETETALLIDSPDLINKYTDYVKRFCDFKITAFKRWCEMAGETYEGVTNEFLDGLINDYKFYCDRNVNADCYDGVYMSAIDSDYNDLRDYYMQLKSDLYGGKWNGKYYIEGRFDPESDYLMVWFNGVRQYLMTETKANIGLRDGFSMGEDEDGVYIRLNGLDENGYDSTSYYDDHGTLTTYREPVNGILTMVIQHPEEGNSSTARTIVLDNSNVVNNVANVYTTKDQTAKPDKYGIRDESRDVSMYPGRVKVYIDGLRQPPDAYTIIDNYTLYINDANAIILGPKSNFPKQSIVDEDRGVYTVNHINPERILVEITQDVAKHETEIELPTDFNGSLNVYDKDLGIDYGILDTQDEIFFFIDGLFCGLTMNDGYYIDFTTGSIVLKDSTVIESLKFNRLEKYIIENPDAVKWATKVQEDYRARTSKNTHKLILEWR